MVSEQEKRQRFRKLAEKRTRNVLNTLRVLGHCSNRSLYSYDDSEIRDIFSAIDKEVKRIKATFERPNAKEFKL